MTANKLSVIKFEKITGIKKQQDFLFELLKKRKHNISHLSMPTRNEHNKFVVNHPYRVWYLIERNNQYIGSIYILQNNCIGVDILNDGYEILSTVFNFIYSRFKPLKEIRSERPRNFFINVSPNNKKIKSELDKIGFKKIQVTYALDLASKN